ncbi:MAG TPA: STAS domain-containing protein [Phycisphaerales bacterium]|nr:STAS domain-containing protein [Phycisphaerales bacterium]
MESTGTSFTSPTATGSATGGSAVATLQNSEGTVFSFSRVGDAAVVTLACPAVREWQASVLHSYLADVVDRNRGRAVIVDVAGIQQFSCAWLNTLIRLTERAAQMGGSLMVVGFSRDTRRLMKSTGVFRRLNVMGSTAEALSAAGAAEVPGWKLAVARMLQIPLAAGGRAGRRAA